MAIVDLQTDRGEATPRPTRNLTRPPIPVADEGWWSRERALVLVLIAATVLACALCFGLAWPFLPALAWALALAVVARPLHDRLAVWIRQPDLAAGVAVALVAIFLIGPALFVGRQLVLEAASRVQQVQDSAQEGAWREALNGNTWVGPALQWVEEHVDVRGEMGRAITSMIGDTATLVSGSVQAVFTLLVTLFTLFFFFRDRRPALEALRRLIPLSDVEASAVFARVDDTIHATVYGTLVVAAVQGFLGGMMFWWLGVQSPLLWGVVMGLLAIVPNLGTFVVWVPTALFFALQAQWGKALLLTAWGALVIALIDNLLYPMLVGNRMRLHTLVAFIAIVGGLALVGPSGLILGPVIVAVTMALVDVWRRRTAGGRTAEEGVSTGRIEQATQ